MNILSELRSRFRSALQSLSPEAGKYAELVLPSQDAKFGDYQANCAMPLGKQLGKPPREIAQSLIDTVNLSDLCEPPEIAGPGFINLKLRNDWLVTALQGLAADGGRLAVAPAAVSRTYVLDYSGPNVAKPMHVGHIRSTVIGDALCRVLRFLGHRVISDNHIGDWGTQFGMIIYGETKLKQNSQSGSLWIDAIAESYRLVNQLVEYYETIEEKIPTLEKKIVENVKIVEQMHDATIPEDVKEQKKVNKRLQQAETQLQNFRNELSDLRRKAAAVESDPQLAILVAEHPNIRAEVLEETAKLHSGHPESRALWNQIMPECLKVIDASYRRIGVTFDHTLGESFYDGQLSGVVTDLKQKGLARESEGAICVFLEGHEAPFIVQKKDGAFLYATTDLATIAYRMREWRPDAILYVVDHRQAFHFEQLFATARLWGYKDVELQHISFGTVLGEDGRPFKTRSGATVGLGGLLDEAIDRALTIVSANDDGRPEPLLSAEERRHVAERIGIGAIKYADLAHNRTSDYVFSYDKMLAMTGNTAAYMQYSYARVRSIFAKGDVSAESLRGGNVKLTLKHPAERALGLAILQFSEALQRVVEDYRPNHLTSYLFDLASRYSEFFENCPVLKAESDEVRASRLLLCDLTARTIKQGLNLLGIEVVERM